MKTIPPKKLRKLTIYAFRLSIFIWIPFVIIGNVSAGSNLGKYDGLENLYGPTNSNLSSGYPLPKFELPYYANTGPYWSSGPHEWLVGPQVEFYNLYKGSGLDFAYGGKTFTIAAMAEGDVVWAKNVVLSGNLGIQVAVKHTIGGSIIRYGHLDHVYQPILDAISKGQTYHVMPGDTIGYAGSTATDNVHLHIELRDGSRDCCGSRGDGGNAIGWHSIELNGYRIYDFRPNELGINPNPPFNQVAYNYDGVAVRVSTLPPDLGPFEYENFSFRDYTGELRTGVWTFLPADFICDAFELGRDNCEQSTPRDDVQFAGHGQLGGGGGILYSDLSIPADQPQPEPPTPNPKSCTPPTAPEGVYLFSEVNYCGYYSYFTLDDPDLSNDVVGNDNTWSIYIVGPYQVQLYRDPGYTGLSEVFLTGDTDLSSNGIFNTTSSLKVTYFPCSLLSQGVTLYSSPNYGGICKTLDTSDSDLSNDNFNDSTWSLKINGSYKVTLFQDPGYTGFSEVFLQNEPDLHDNPIFNTTSSLLVENIQCNPSADGVTLFAGANFTGACQTFNTDVTSLPLLNDSVWSIKINGSYRATIFQDPNYNGISETFLSSESDLHDNYIYNYASSLKVTPIPCNPNSDGVTVFAGTNFTGVCRTYTTNAPSMSDGLNDYVWSVRVRGPYRATLYKDPGYTGVSEIFDWEDTDLSNNQIFNTTSSIKVEKITCDPGSGGITLYSQPNYGGPCTTFKTDDLDLTDNGIRNDNTYSIRVIGLFKGELFLHINYQGQSIALSDDIPDLRSSVIGNGASSVKVTALPPPLKIFLPYIVSSPGE